MSIAKKIKQGIESFSNKTQASIEQTEKEKELASKIINNYRRAKDAKASKIKIWKECIDAYNGHTNNTGLAYKADHNSNFIFSTIETIKPIMTDNEPKFMTIPMSERYVDSADTIQLAFDYEWRRTRMQEKLTEALTLGLQIGTFIWALFWDSKASNGLGEVKPVLINPFNFFPDPMATSMEDAQFVIYACYKSVEELRTLFPNKASLLAPGSIKEEDLVVGNNDLSSVRNQILVLECWTKDYDEFEIVEQDGQKVKKQKYPKGRVITVTMEGVLLEDKPNPYDDGKFPFIVTKNYQMPFEFWGMSEVQQLLKPQFYINDLNNQIIDNARLTGNMPWVIDKNSGIGFGKLVNRPGLVIRKNPGTEVGRMSPPTMPRYIQDKIDELKMDMEIISGIHDITQGRKPGGITAAAAIEALQEAGQARIRLKVRLMEYSLAQLGEMWFSRMKQYWVGTREIQKLNPDFSFEFADINEDILKAEVQFFVVAGSTMPVNRASRLQQMISLAQTGAEDGMPMIDRQAVLEAASIPDRDKILQRFADLKAQQMAQPAPQQAVDPNTGQPIDPNMIDPSMMQPPTNPMLDGMVQIMSQMPPDLLAQMMQMMMSMMAQAMPQAMMQQQQMAMQPEQMGPEMMGQAQEQPMMQGQGDNSALAQVLIEKLGQLPDEEVNRILENNPEIAEIVNKYGITQ